MRASRRMGIFGSGSSVPPYQTLEAMSWANIALVAAAGKASEYWSAGDTKTITFGSAVLGSTTITVEILAFDYDDLAAGGKAPISFGMVDCFSTTVRLNPASSNVGGWGSCELRSTLINTVLPALQAAIGSDIIKPVSKRTSAGNQSSTINTTTDSVWLLSEYEVFGVATNSAVGEKPTDKSICYPAFTDAASRIKRRDGSYQHWWERSPGTSSSLMFCLVSIGGSGSVTASSGSPTSAQGIAIGFCV